MPNDDSQLNLPKREEGILDFWEENQIFEKTLEKTKKGKPFIFYEGPPFANGHPGIHHVEARVFKDVFLRFKTMRGYSVPRKAGWDTHGLPAELQVEKELGLKNKRDIERYGVAGFNQKCKESVWKYKTEWEEFTKRIGFWLDLKNAYVTYENSYIESLWFIIKRFWETKALYQGDKIIPWCSRCGTGLSSHELGQPGVYRKVKDPSLYVKLKIKNKKDEYLIIWTTTPWTLPGNVAVAVNPNILYKKFLVDGKYIWSGTTNFAKDPNQLKELDSIKGKNLVGLEYEAPYPEKNIPYQVLAGDFVTTEDGTGMVHLAPAFGEEDMSTVKRAFGAKFPILKTVTPEGTMAKGIIGEGMSVYDANKIIGEDLEKRGLLMRLQWYEHEYPHCWRCDTPLLYLARESWWVKKPVEKLLANNKKVNWIPEYIKEGRFGEWLSEKKDWAFSRERYWGAPLPIWHCKKCQHIEVLGSINELLQKVGEAKNRYFVMRHGESEANMLHVIDSSLHTHHLTDKGKNEVEKTIGKLKKQDIDIIISSDILRTKETAEIIAKALGKKVIFEPRFREIQMGVLNGKPSQEYHTRFPRYEDKYARAVEGGERLGDVRARMIAGMKDLEEKYSGKNILIVSHEYPIWQLWAAGQGMSEAETIQLKQKLKDKDFIKTGEVLPFPYKSLPYSHTGELDVHRPFIDEVTFSCIKCHGEMKRVPEVCDVWFDSGAMPFAQNHWPFPSPKSYRKSPKFFPAEFIAEGVDQTRGWFYTLLTVSTLLGFQSPYKNVISLGHVLDAKGQKMSKSKGNIVSPNEMIEKYGVDTLRWYFYTINGPGDSKSFDEKDLANKLRGFLSTFWNSYLLFETYAPERIKISNSKPNNILDQWILLRLEEVQREVTKILEMYDAVSAARAIEEFLVSDFSQWYLRRSRRRFQKPEDQKELNDVSIITAYVLLELTKLSAPFVPFFAEIIFQKLRGRVGAKELSVHLAAWSKPSKEKNKDILAYMKLVRGIVSEALQLRAAAGIKVRQPLVSLQIKKQKFPKGFSGLIKDEVNVKEIIFGSELKLDTHVTPELREEGIIRDITRIVQEMRKDGGMKPADKIILQVEVPQNLQNIMQNWMAYIRNEVGAHQILFGGKRSFKVEREEVMNNEKVWFGIRKA